MGDDDAPTVAERHRLDRGVCARVPPPPSSTPGSTAGHSTAGHSTAGSSTPIDGKTTGASTRGSSTRGSSTLGLSDALGGASTGTELPAPETVLRRSAYEQTRRTAASGLLFNVVGGVCAPLVGGHPIALRLFVLGMISGALYNAWLLYMCRSEATYRQRHAVIYFTVAAFNNIPVLYYVGAFGPIGVMFVMNVYSACLSYSRRVARVVLVGSMLPFALVGGGIAVGVIEDHSVIRLGETVGTGGRILVVICFLVFLVLTYAQARTTRELMVASLVERDSAVRLASHREALILEARQDLDRALSAGGLGRFSERTLGSFKLGAVLGRGAMGEVYEARHVTTGEPAAVKMLLPEVLNRPAYVHRFLREVRIAASLDAPNVVRVLEIGDESAAMPYLAMERLRGEDLATILRNEEHLPQDDVVDLVRQIGAGLAAASAAGIVHRDLKPQNVFRTVDAPPVWKILDFGVSKLADDGDGAGLTRGEAIGTPRYMAPEQARGEDVDIRADLYALAVIAYRALTGQPPFKGDDLPVLVEVLTRMPARPGSLTPLHAHVDSFFAVALAKRREDRFATPDAMVNALEAALAGKLGRKVRERAGAVLETHPWGSGRERSGPVSAPPPSGRAGRRSTPHA